MSPDLRNQHATLDEQFCSVAQEIVDDAVRAGDLSFPEGVSSNTLTFTLIVLNDGLASVLRGSVPKDLLDSIDPVQTVFQSMQVLLDGYGWRPLSSEWDYADTERRVEEMFLASSDADAAFADK